MIFEGICRYKPTITTFQFLQKKIKMTDKMQSSQSQPIVKIGHYTLGQTLGVGTFGKVKSKYLKNF